MKVILTGATGFIGSALIRRLREDGNEVFPIGRVADADLLSALLESHGPFDGCIHLASLFLSAHREDQIPALVYSNVAFATRVAEAAVRIGCRWFVNTGTCWQHYEGAEYSPVNLYAATKQAFEDVLVYYREAFGIRTATLELTDTYGPGDTRPKLVNLWCKSLDKAEPLLMSSGTQQIELVHRDDVVNGFCKLAQFLDGNDERIDGDGESYHLNTGEVVTVRQAAKVFEVATGGVLPIVWGGRPERQREMRVVVHKGAPLPGWKPSMSLMQGFKEVYADFLANQ